MTSRWDFYVNYTGAKKQVSGMTFYKVSIGSDVRWVSMSGIKTLVEAHRKGVKKDVAMRAASKYTGQATQRRVKRMRENIRQNWTEYIRDLETGDFDDAKLKKGIKSMAERGNVSGTVWRDLERLLTLMNEEELKILVKENKGLLQDFFADSEPLRGATSNMSQIEASERNVQANAKRLRDRMLEILARRR